MTKVKIVTDSTAVLSDAEIKDLGIKVIPLNVMIDDKTYTDGVDLSREEFMDKMAQAKNLPKTSTPALGVFTDAYEDLLANDDDVEIISIHLTPGLSGTFDTAQQAAKMLETDKIHVIDSTFIDCALGFQAIKAAELAQQGKSATEIMQEIKAVHANTELYLTLSSLDNLTAGGRISKATGFISGLLNIKIGAHIVNGDIIAETKGRGSKTIKNYLKKIVDQMHEAKGIQRIGLSHAGIPELAQELADILRTEFPEAQVHVQQTTPVVSTHTGAGAFGLSYLKQY
ncbi:DegV family protein [Weissella koreensis]|uniref:DegV family protein n=1 Tax=Weissella koreensis TaxID=165096 RepID=A0A7H1MKB8_9LACO|nr:DegV family protein [Weissella koreensis]AEJ23046.1 DegV family protein [Weissella koreensis KACC 15510]AVH74645.1 DegV family protein [Weissella koreensis]EJF34000.1 DegV family protein [Weissella koreensis KCTC 3621]EJF34290.1 DegV family protein [Weissella koreensis KCTC 3621]MCZ9310491.1 DegV family protein [Weissella koreensis]